MSSSARTSGLASQPRAPPTKAPTMRMLGARSNWRRANVPSNIPPPTSRASSTGPRTGRRFSIPTTRAAYGTVTQPPSAIARRTHGISAFRRSATDHHRGRGDFFPLHSRRACRYSRSARLSGNAAIALNDQIAHREPVLNETLRNGGTRHWVAPGQNHDARPARDAPRQPSEELCQRRGALGREARQRVADPADLRPVARGGRYR